MSPKFAAMLRALGMDVKALREEFPQNILDINLFRQLSGRDVALVGPDMKQLTRQAEARELKAAGISAVYFGAFWSKYELWPQAAWLVKNWPGIDSFMKIAARGTVVEISQKGRADLIR